MKHLSIIFLIGGFLSGCCNKDGVRIPRTDESRLKIVILSSEKNSTAPAWRRENNIVLYRSNPNLGGVFSFLDYVDFNKFDVIYVEKYSSAWATGTGSTEISAYINPALKEINVYTDFNTQYCWSFFGSGAESVSLESASWIQVNKLPLGYAVINN